MAFATADNVRRRLGRGSLTSDQTTQAEMLLDAAATAILDAVDKTGAWADAQDTLPAAFKDISIELVARVMLNPAGARSTSRQLGAFQESTSFRDGMGSLELTDSEEARAR